MGRKRKSEQNDDLEMVEQSYSREKPTEDIIPTGWLHEQFISRHPIGGIRSIYVRRKGATEGWKVCSVTNPVHMTAGYLWALMNPKNQNGVQIDIMPYFPKGHELSEGTYDEMQYMMPLGRIGEEMSNPMYVDFLNAKLVVFDDEFAKMERANQVIPKSAYAERDAIRAKLDLSPIGDAAIASERQETPVAIPDVPPPAGVSPADLAVLTAINGLARTMERMNQKFEAAPQRSLGEEALGQAFVNNQATMQLLMQQAQNASSAKSPWVEIAVAVLAGTDVSEVVKTVFKKNVPVEQKTIEKDGQVVTVFTAPPDATFGQQGLAWLMNTVATLVANPAAPGAAENQPQDKGHTPEEIRWNDLAKAIATSARDRAQPATIARRLEPFRDLFESADFEDVLPNLQLEMVNQTDKDWMILNGPIVMLIALQEWGLVVEGETVDSDQGAADQTEQESVQDDAE